jgi:hypothetical protein
MLWRPGRTFCNNEFTQKAINIYSIYEPNNRVLKICKGKTVRELKEEIDQSTIIPEDFNILLSVMERTTR